MKLPEVTNLCGTMALLCGVRVIFIEQFNYRNAKVQPSDRSPVKHALEGFTQARITDSRRAVAASTLRAPPKATPPSNIQSNHTLAVFYNSFVPANKRPARILKNIIQEQLKQVRNSSYRTVYYNLIGHNLKVEEFCVEGLDCILLHYLKEGNEVDTLQELYDYCLQEDSSTTTTTTTVAYIHDKGSYHNEKANRKMRRIATRAALSDACAQSHEQGGCNVCSSRMQLIPHWHAPSNMWAAKCDYVRTLIPPREYEARRRSMFAHLLKNPSLFHCLDKALLEGVIDEDGSYLNESALQPLALGRYAYETWVYSAPTLVPCHVADRPLSDFFKGLEDWTPHWMEGPGIGIGEYRGVQKLDWFHKKGRLFEMQYLYNSTPLPLGKSWFWKSYRNEKVNAKPAC